MQNCLNCGNPVHGSRWRKLCPDKRCLECCELLCPNDCGASGQWVVKPTIEDMFRKTLFTIFDTVGMQVALSVLIEWGISRTAQYGDPEDPSWHDYLLDAELHTALENYKKRLLK